MTETLTVRVKSETDPKLTYLLHAQGDAITCSCRGYLSHGHCKHSTALLAVLHEGDDMTTETGTEIVKADAPPAPIIVNDTPTALLPTRGDLEAMALIAGTAVKAVGMIPAAIKTKEQALAIMLAGWELGLRPMTALRHVYTVNGKTEIETRAMVGIIKARRADVQFAWPEYTADAVTCTILRPGQPLTTVRYTKADATASGQMAKPGPWKSYTRDMLYAAATKRACRLACPDLINAIETGLQHTEHEAVSLMMPDAEVSVLDAPPDEVPADIPADAFNEGDEPADGEYTEVVDTAKDRQRIRALLAEANENGDAAWKAGIFDYVSGTYPDAHNEKRQFVIKELSDEQAHDLAVELERRIHGGGPEQGSLV